MIGIDRIIINNFQILNFEKLDMESKRTFKDTSRTEEIEVYGSKHEFFNIKFSVHTSNKNILYTSASLDFNPNKILTGTNVSNSSVEALQEALSIITDSLQSNGVEIDLSDARIKYIEINKNLNIPYKDLEEILLAVGRANYKNSESYGAFNEENTPSKIRVNKSTYVNLADRKILIYDKRFEMLRKHKHDIGFDLTRFEVKINRDYYRRKMNELGLDNSLQTLISNSQILETLYAGEIGLHIFKTTENYILNTIKPNLDKCFKAFKRAEKYKSKERERLKSQNKDIPDKYKITRGVLKYLSKHSWIFDVEFLLEVIKNNVEQGHTTREMRRAIKNHGEIRNYKLFQELKEQFIFFRQ
jgi:hypothetical protein